MSDTEMEGSILIDGQSFSLSDLANFSWDDVAAVKSTRLPQGTYEFTVDETKMEAKEITDKDGEKVKCLAIGIVLKVAKVHGIIQPKDEDEIEPDSLIDKKHFETFFIRTTESFGRFKQFLIDTGYEPTVENRGSFNATIQGFVGHHFNAPIKHAKNKNDPEAPPYVNLRQDKIKPAIAA